MLPLLVGLVPGPGAILARRVGQDGAWYALHRAQAAQERPGLRSPRGHSPARSTAGAGLAAVTLLAWRAAAGSLAGAIVLLSGYTGVRFASFLPAAFPYTLLIHPFGVHPLYLSPTYWR